MNAHVKGTFVINERKKVICKAIDEETAKEIADMYKHIECTRPPKYSTVDNHLWLIKWISLSIFTAIAGVLLIGIMLGLLPTSVTIASLTISAAAAAIIYGLADAVLGE